MKRSLLFLCMVLLVQHTFSQTVNNYSVPGTYTWVVPSCVTSVTVRAWGAGGAGGGASATDRNGGGGGGGAYSIKTETVTPGETLRITVGTGGTGGTGTGGAGGFSQVEHLTGPVVFCRAVGGAGGTKGGGVTSPGSGGSGGLIASNVPVNVGFSGGNGGSSIPDATSIDQGGGGGGGAGTGSNGGNGGTPTSGVAGSPGGGSGGSGASTSTAMSGSGGAFPGGGGGGGATWNSSANGGAGGGGQVTISYIATGCEPVATMFPYSAPGTYSWVVPACVNFVSVEAWGAGGGGGGNIAIIKTSGSSTETCTGAGGGGGGGYAARTYAVVPGETYTIVVGNGGSGGAAGAGTTGGGITTPAGIGGTGQSSTFSGPATISTGTLTGTGGTGGGGAGAYNTVVGTCSLANGSAGAGGNGLNGTVNYTGGSGAAGLILDHSTDKSGGGGGAAGPGGPGGTALSPGSVGVATPPAGVGNPPGGNGGTGKLWNTPALSQQNGDNGVAFGGGGGGSLIHTSNSGVFTAIGGEGARGEVRLTYNTACPLPVELSYFEGECTSQGKQFKWTTDTELNNDYFTLEGSNDGKDWVSLEKVQGAGNSQTKQYYSLNSSARSMNYFRLKQTDFNGAFTLSNPISVFCSSLDEIVLYPIPAKNVLNIKGLKPNANYQIQMLNLNGELIHQMVKNTENKNNLELNIESIAMGVYLLEILDEQHKKQVLKFIKE